MMIPQRDINALVDMGLIAGVDGIGGARRGIILAFSPLRKEPEVTSNP